jgi:outer membrane biosynthesis protein TonB
MQGRVRLDQQDMDFQSLQGLAQRRGELYVLPLPETAKGKVSWGDVTVLFQLVQPALEERMVMPSSFRRPWYRAREPLFMTVLAISLLFHLILAIALYLAPKPPDTELELDQLPDRFARVFMPPKPREPERVKETKPEQAEATEEEKHPKKDDKPKHAAVDSAQRKAAIQQKVASKGLLKILGSAGANGAFQDVLGASTGGRDIATALAGASGVGFATSDAVGAGGPKGAGSGKVAGIGDVGTSGGGHVNLGAKGDVSVSGKVRDAAPEVDSADVDRDALARYVKARLKAIQNCYERELKRNPTLKGRVVVRFSITRGGRTGDIEVEENTLGNEAVGSCIRTVIRSWIFPFKPDDDVPVAYPFLFAPAS